MSKEFQRFALNFKRNIHKLTDEEFYEAYDEAFHMIGFKDWTLTNLKYFKDWISGDFLEVGCAGGRVLKAVRFLCDECWGVDVSGFALIEAYNFVQDDVGLVWADVEQKLPFPSNTFNTVLCGHTLEHLRNPKRAFHELMRVSSDKVIILIPLQSEADRWKPTNLHVQFWATVDEFHKFCGVEAKQIKVLRDNTLAILLFRKVENAS